jgi:hypothetical protein
MDNKAQLYWQDCRLLFQANEKDEMRGREGLNDVTSLSVRKYVMGWTINSSGYVVRNEKKANRILWIFQTKR